MPTVATGYYASVTPRARGVDLVDYLVDRAWSLSPAQQVHYDMRVDENLSPVEIKTVDDTTKKIEI